MRVGFLINPIAGMGGRVGLKGTDGMVDEARRLGARPIARIRAATALHRFKELLSRERSLPEISWLTCSGSMGEDVLRACGFEGLAIAYHTPPHPGALDTASAVKTFVSSDVDLIVFCGGDGTARDVWAVIGENVPMLGIPSGVKMYSGVFGTTPERTAEILANYVAGKIDAAEAEILDLDEKKYRKGIWALRLSGTARTPLEPSYTQTAKAIISEHGDDEVKAAIADEIAQEIQSHRDDLFLLGPGSTVQEVASRLGLEKTLLGIDAVIEGKIVGQDLNEGAILALISQHPRARLILSPIGAQGFVLGRGNLQVSPAAVRRIGFENLIVIATPSKLKRTPFLRFDTGDRELDHELANLKFLPVYVGYHRRRLVPVSI
jgi:predicted polyphosphate/ATP-dependent NAD kinase